MFIKTAGFKKLIKEAYKGSGLRIGNTGNGLYIGGSYWVMQVKTGHIPKEKLAAIIELIGGIPLEGENMQIDKSGEQYELQGNDLYNVIENAQSCTESLEVTDIIIEFPHGGQARALQHKETGFIRLVSEQFIKMIDNKEVNEREGHSKYEGPFTGRLPGIFWRNNIMALYVMPFSEDGYIKLIHYLENYDLTREQGDAIPEDENK